MTIVIEILIVCSLSIAGFAISYYLTKNHNEAKKEKLESEIKILNSEINNLEQKKQEQKQKINEYKNQSKIQSKEIILEAKEKAQDLIDKSKKEIETERKSIERLTEKLEREETQVERESKKIESEKEKIIQKQTSLNQKEQELKIKETSIIKELERIANLTKEEAKSEIIKQVQEQEQKSISESILVFQEELKDQQEKIAKEILGSAVQRYASIFVADATTIAVPLPDDEMKGRIIGKEGRNIKTFEEVTGTDILIDDTPGSVVVSCFEPIRREIAKIALTNLIKDGRIQPAKIEEEVKNAKIDIMKTIKQKGEESLMQIGLSRFNPKLLTLLGRLYFRTSYGQNVLSHSVETAEIGLLLAGELGYKDKDKVKQACLLHDIGKSVDREVEGTHVELGVKILKKHNFPEDVVYAVHAHHEDVRPQNLLDFIVIAADAISSSKPGARRDSFENYIKRLEGLEKIATSYDEVKKAYAISAGREIRIFVSSRQTDDNSAIILANKISKDIEKNLTYPGQIKVNVIRQFRVIEYAR